MHSEEIDLCRLDTTAMTHEQWERSKRQVRRRAHAERSRMIGELFGRLFRWRDKASIGVPARAGTSRA